MNAYRGPPVTLGSNAAAQVRIIVWCRDCRHTAEPDPAEMTSRYGADTPVHDWARRLVCCPGRSGEAGPIRGGFGKDRRREIEPSTSIIAFVKAVVDQWAALATGGVIIAALALWERFYRPIPRKVYALIMIFALVAAFYLTWATERQKNIELAQALNTQRLEIVDLKFKKYGKSTKYSLDAWVTNTGPQAISTPVPVKHDPIYSSSNLPKDEVERIMHQLENDAKRKTIPPSNTANLIYPGKTTIITVAEEFLTEEQVAEINNGTLAVYVFFILKYSDKSMRPNHSRATEYCGYYAGGTDYRHNIVDEVVDWDQ